MKKPLLALATAAVLATATLAPTAADARCRGCAVGLGVLGGVIVGSAIAGAYAYPRVYYPAPGYEPYYAYYAPAPVACPGGYWARRPIYDRWGNVVGYSRPRWFCPPY
jgi:hypothetical protein